MRQCFALFRTLGLLKVFKLPIQISYLTVLFLYPRLLQINAVTLLLYYLYCLCKFFKDRFFLNCFSFQKADAKVRTFKYIFQIISKVFFLFSFSRRLSLRKGDKRRRKNVLSTVSVSKSISRLSVSWKAGAKVADISIRSKYIYHFFTGFLKQFCNSLINKDVVEHIFERERKQQ